MSGSNVTVEGRELRVTSLDKVLYPATGTTKADVMAYVAEIAPVVMPHLRGRPVTRKRWVDGTDAEAFFAKQLEAGAPEWIARTAVQHTSRVVEYPLVTEPATLVWFLQMAALEWHVPQWRFDQDGLPSHPDRLVVDLDPGPGAGLAQCVEVAHHARELLTGMGLTAVPVTSGSKGIHLYAGLVGTATSEQVSAVAKELARALQDELPALVVTEQKKTLRERKVLVDWSQNSAAKTTVSPYSPRGRARPWVAAPRTWEEIEGPGLTHLEMAEVLEAVRRRGDPFAALSPDRLARYRSMRDPQGTPEPVPPAPPAPRTGAPVFVMQDHEARRRHLDFRLEREGVLVSWALPKGEPTDPARNHLAVATEDHPLEYAAFEGTIPKGEYGAGEVRIWDSGTYETEKWRDDEVIVTLAGRRGRRRIALIRTEGDQWLAHLMAPAAVAGRARPDAAGSGDRATSGGEGDQATSGGQGGAAASGGRKRPPAAAPGETPAPMLATAGRRADVAHDDGEWAIEMKWDGYRAIATVRGGAVTLTSRGGKDLTGTFPELSALADAVAGDAVLDGEIVALDARGRPDFARLQRRAGGEGTDVPVKLLLFDVLEADGRALLGEPYAARRAVLEGLVTGGDVIDVPPVFAGDFDEAFATSRRLGLEGVVAKRTDSPYRPGRRTSAWVKVKHSLHEEVVVIGWRPGKGGRARSIGSLLVAVPEGSGLRYAGRVGTGFTDRQLTEIAERLGRIARATPPVKHVPPDVAADAHWVTAKHVAEVEHGGWTGERRLRHARWRGWRDDKRPADLR